MRHERTGVLGMVGADVRPGAGRRAFDTTRGSAAQAVVSHPLEYQLYYAV